MSKYKIENPNRQFNDWDAVEEQIANLDKKIDEAVAGTTSFENIQGNPEDNTALAQILDEKADDDDIANLQSQINDKVDKVNGKELMPSNLPTQVQQNTDAIGNINTALGNKVDKVNGYGLMPNNLPDRVAQNETDIQDLKDDKQDVMQFEELPDAQAYLGKIVQYIGPTTPLLTNGYFYQADYNSETLTYEWIEKLSGGGANYTAGQGIEITNNEIKCTLINDTITSTTTTWSSQKLRHEFEAIAGATKVFVVATLPQVGELNSIYYQGTEAPYNIYLYTSNNEWVYIGTTGINLQDYYTKTEVDSLLNVIRNDILDNNTNAGYGISVSQLPNHLGKSIAAHGTAPIKVVVSDGITLDYNEGLDVNSNGQLKVNIGDGLKLNGTNNTIVPNVDGDSVRINSDGEMYVPLKNVAGENIIGTGNISFKTVNGESIKGTGNIITPAYDDFFAKVGEIILYSGPIIGYLAYYSTRYMTCLTFFKSLKNITNLRIKKLDVAFRDNGGYLKYHAVIGDTGVNTGANFPIVDNYTDQKTGITADGYKTGSENQWWLNINLDQAARITTTLTGNPPLTNTPLMFMFSNCEFECI